MTDFRESDDPQYRLGRAFLAAFESNPENAIASAFSALRLSLNDRRAASYSRPDHVMDALNDAEQYALRAMRQPCVQGSACGQPDCPVCSHA